MRTPVTKINLDPAVKKSLDAHPDRKPPLRLSRDRLGNILLESALLREAKRRSK